METHYVFCEAEIELLNIYYKNLCLHKSYVTLIIQFFKIVLGNTNSMKRIIKGLIQYHPDPV